MDGRGLAARKDADMEHRLLSWLGQYGAGVLFCAQMFGIFGLPIPDELLLTVAGALARQGQLGIASTIVAAIAGCMCGITLSYVRGRTVGLATLRRVVHVSDAAFDRAHRWFHRSGGLLLMFGYFIPGVRHLTGVLAGTSGLEYRIFATFAYLGAFLWATGFVLLGWYASEEWEHMLRHTHRAALAMVILAATAGGIYFLLRRRHRR